MKSTIINLLIVEDNPFIGEKIFSAAKEVKSIKAIQLTKSLQEAVSFLNNTRFNFLILDLKLPDGNGVELLKLLKGKETKVFVFSISTELKQACLKHGAFAFFDKAKDFDKLIEALKNI